MPVYEITRKTTLPEAEFPATHLNLKVLLEVDYGTNVPPSAGRAIALRLAREALANLRPDDITAASVATRPEGPTDADRHGDWVQPADLDLRLVKSAHRMVMEVSQRGTTGKAVLASDLVGDGGLSAPTVGRLLRIGDPGHDYLRQYVLVTPAGRTKALDLTPAGRLLASRIRAKAVPA